MNRQRRVREVRRGSAYYASPVPKRNKRSAPVFPKISFSDLKKIFIAGSLVLALIFVWNLFGINKITIEGNKSLSQEQLQTFLKEESGGAWRNNLLTFSGEETAERVKERDYRLKQVEIKRVWPNSLRVIVAERAAALRWQTGDEVWVLDADGAVIASAESLPSKLPIVVDSTGLPVKAGDKVVPERFVKFAADVNRLVPKRGRVKIEELRVPETTSELYAKTDKGYVLKFDTTRPASGEVEAMAKVLQEMARQGKSPAEYIDLRIEGKAYYR